MSEPSEDILKIELPHNKQVLTFENPQGLLAWQQKLRDEWSWLGNTPAKAAWAPHETLLNHIRSSAENWSRVKQYGGRDAQLHSNIARLILELYNPTNYIYGDHAKSIFLKEVKNKYGNYAAAGVLAAFSKVELNLERSVGESFFTGLLRGFLYENEIEWTASAHREVLEGLEAQYKQRLDDQEKRLQHLEDENSRLNAAYEATLEAKSKGLDELCASKTELLDTLHQTKSKLFEEFHEQKNTSFIELTAKHETNLKNVEDTFHNKLALQKPIDYWREKKTRHVILAKRFAWASTAVLLVLGGGLASLINWTFGSLEGNENPRHWQVGVTIVTAFFVIWIVRILIRMFLSHQHLATDAAERVTMVQTYLSLSLEGKGFAPEDRSVILQQLFKPASDGLVKDDGAPPSWMEFLSRTK